MRQRQDHEQAVVKNYFADEIIRSCGYKRKKQRIGDNWDLIEYVATTELNYLNSCE